jgi:uncharacterized protein with FMN-binding domain
VSNGGSNKKVANSLVALSSAAVLSVYGAGYVRTRAAADRIALQATDRRSHSRPSGRDSAIEAKLPASQHVPPGAPSLSLEPHLPAPALPSASSTPHQEASVTAPPQDIAGARRRGTTPAAHEVPSTASHTDEPTPAVTPTTESAAPAIEETAPAPSAAPSIPPSDKARYRDGTYFGWGTSRHGDIQAAVLVEEGRIVSATVAQCLTRYSCSWIAPLPARIVRDQGTTFDYVSGATESSDAFQDAVADALTHAQ